ncbi:MBL fold metallo-hydrolase [soil metagenome]
MLEFIDDLGHGIYAIDTDFQRPRLAAAYLMVADGRAAFIDTGTNFAVPRLLAALDGLGLAPAAVDWVIPTHVHLDHAGGVGLLMQSLPTAQVLVHPRGQRHMIDPGALWQGALAVYGEAEMLRSYGQLQPVAAERVLASHDEQTIHLGTRPLRLIDTPGHARHHHCIWDAQTRGWFTGDTFGLSYREFDNDAHGAWALPTSTPVQFDPPALKASIRRMLGHQPQAMYLTHYSRVSDIERLADLLLSQIDEMAALGLALKDAPDRHRQLVDGLWAGYARRLAEHGCALAPAQQHALLAMDIELNAQGLGVWLDRAERTTPA